MSDGVAMTTYLPAGSYRVQLGKVEGYADIPEQVIEVQTGKITDLAVALVQQQ